jgi:hypothetical protein
MKTIDATDTIERMLKKVVDENRHTGCIDVHIECNQGGVRAMKVAVSSKIAAGEIRTSIFEFGGSKPDVVEPVEPGF